MKDDPFTKLRELREEVSRELEALLVGINRVSGIVIRLDAELGNLEGNTRGGETLAGERPGAAGPNQVLCYWAIYLEKGEPDGEWVSRAKIEARAEALRRAEDNEAPTRLAIKRALRDSTKRRHIRRDGDRYQLLDLGEEIMEARRDEILGLPEDV